MTPATIIEQAAPPFASTSTSSPAQQLDHLLHSVGVSPIDNVGWIRVTGSDRVRWLNGMVTNSIQDLKLGEGSYSFALNAQGQIQGDLYTFAACDASLLLQTARDRVPAMMSMFDRFIIMDDVELEDISLNRFGCAITGPDATKLLERIGLTAPHRLSPNSLSAIDLLWNGNSPIQLIAAYSPLVPRFELWTDEATRKAISGDLAEKAVSLQGGPLEAAALEHLRLLEGTPRFGTDIHEKTLAQETNQTRALHFSKGCYLGQEIVERIRSRGNVHRSISAFRLDGPLPPTGTSILSDGKPIAELTSVAAIPLADGILQLGLGLARREAVDRGATLTYATETASGTAIPKALPVPISPITP